MPNSIEFRNIIPTRKVYQDLARLMKSPESMNGIVKDAEEEIKKKTKRGVDFQNRPFEDLKEPYKTRKAKLGYGSKANLSFTGKMLKAMRTKVVSFRHGKVFISEQNYPRNPKTGQRPRIDTKTLSSVHGKGTGRMPKREHMNISKSFEKKLLKKWYDKPILKILGRG